MTIQPIQTRYKGCRFRSRTEARWAVFFDVLGLKWEYEKEGYDLGELGWYLPDFWLPEWKCFAEVKGEAFTEQERAKCKRLSQLTTLEVLLLAGGPGTSHSEIIHLWWVESGRGETELAEFSGWLVNWEQSVSEGRVWWDLADDLSSYGSTSRQNQATEAARRARFEFGESGAGSPR